jgi:dextranase
MSYFRHKQKLFLINLTILSLILSLVLPSRNAVQAKNKQLPIEPILSFLVDKARYNPGEEVKMSLLFDSSVEWKGILHLEVYHLNEKIAEGKKNIHIKKNLKGLEIKWNPPSEDFRGYLVKAYIEGSDQIVTAAIDVSSDWTHFPRYGYTTEFPQESAVESDKKMKQLAQEYYLNGFQFYDWMWRHDVSVYSKTDSNGKPILDKKGDFITEEITPNTSYNDLLGRKIYPLTVKQQIQAAQKYNAAAMAYQMNYAARENYESFGVKKEWGMYKKNAAFPYPDPDLYQEGFFFDWVNPPTALYLQDPGNSEWQEYITEQFDRSVNEFGFDGIHLDQWGWSDNDYLYSYEGEKRYFSKDYDSIINAVKDSLVKNNDKKSYVTFNMVGGNDGYEDVPSPSTKTDFDYSEIWQDKDNYRDLLKVVEETRKKNGGKAVVIAGYMNYKQATGDHYEIADVKGIPKSEQFISRINQIPGWVGDFGKKDEDKIIWTVDVPETGTYNISLKYGHDNQDSPEGRISVNDQVVVNDITFTEKTGWGNPVAFKNMTVDLKKGKNKIKLQLNTNNLWLNIDSLVLQKDSFEKEFEAEYAELISCKVDKYGHVYYFETDGDFIEFTVHVNKAGSYPINFHYGVERLTVNRHLYVNGELVSNSITFEPTGGWESFGISKDIYIPLKAGENKVVIKVENVNDTGVKIDYLEVGDTRYEAEKAKIGWEPTTQPVLEKSEDRVVNFKQKGDFLSFKFESDNQQEVPISVFYKNSGQKTERSLFVNGKKAGIATFPQTEGDDWSKIEIPIFLYNGTNEIQLKMENETTERGIEVDKFELNNIVREAEQAESGWSPVLPKTGEVMVDPGFTNNFGLKGQRVTFSINNQYQTKSLKFKYRSGNNPKVNIYLDGEIIAKNITFASTPGGWSGPMVEKSVEANVSAGEHEVVFEIASDHQYINLDSLIVGDEEYQVEDASFAPEGNGITTTVGHVFDFKDEGDFINFEINVAEEGNYDLVWRYNNDSESKRMAHRSVYVNDEKIDNISFPYTNDWKDITITDVPLKEGRNMISIKVENIDDDGVKLDYLQVGSKKYHAESANFLPPMHIYKDTLLNFGHTGDEVTFDVNLAEEGETSFIFTYSNGGEVTKRTIYIDGKPILDDKGNPYEVVFNSTGSFDSFSEDGYIVLPNLKAGKHKITLKQEENQKGTIHLRCMTVGFFNEPSVRLMDAGLAAMGATHIELGTAENYEEGPNMLAHEYYPNRSKKMTSSLKQSLKEYYKFFAAYENLLFDSTMSNVEIKVEDHGKSLKVSSDGESNTIWSIVRNNKNNEGYEDYAVVHLINMLNNDQNWRNAATRPELKTNLTIRYPIGKTLEELPNLKVYTASPDHNHGQLKEIPYRWENNELVITLPRLEYWEMIVIDHDGLQNIKTSKIKW